MPSEDPPAIRIRARLLAAAALPLGFGCGRSDAIRPGDVRCYTVPRESSGRPATAGAVAAAPVPPGGVKYEIPAGWSDKGGSGMRLATLAIGDPADGHEVTVIRAAGSLRGNVERWQRQLTPSAPADAVEAAVDRAISAAKEVDVAGKRGTVVLLDDASAAEGDAILAAIIPDDESSSLFVKFRGAAAVARREKDAFVRFVSSIRPD